MFDLNFAKIQITPAPSKKSPLFSSQLPDRSVGKESTCNAGDPGLIPESGRSTGEWIGYPLQFSGPENSMDYIVCGVAKSRM